MTKGALKIPPQHKEAKQKAMKGLVVCPSCHNIYYKKAWHAANSKELESFKRSKQELNFKLCPACEMKKNHLFEGEIVISEVPKKYKPELVHLLLSQGAQMQKKDPQDRIIDIEETKDGYRVTTTEDQMAQKLAKKIKKVFNKVDLDISYSGEPFEVVRIRVQFLR